MNPLPLFFSGLYIETIVIDDKKFYAVMKDNRLLMYTSSKKNAKSFLTANRESENDQSNS